MSVGALAAMLGADSKRSSDCSGYVPISAATSQLPLQHAAATATGTATATNGKGQAAKRLLASGHTRSEDPGQRQQRNAERNVPR